MRRHRQPEWTTSPRGKWRWVHEEGGSIGYAVPGAGNTMPWLAIAMPGWTMIAAEPVGSAKGDRPA